MAKYNWTGRKNDDEIDTLNRAGITVLEGRNGPILRLGPELGGHGTHITPPSEAMTRQELIAQLEAQQKARLKGKPR